MLAPGQIIIVSSLNLRANERSSTAIHLVYSQRAGRGKMNRLRRVVLSGVQDPAFKSKPHGSYGQDKRSNLLQATTYGRAPLTAGWRRAFRILGLWQEAHIKKNKKGQISGFAAYDGGFLFENGLGDGALVRTSKLPRLVCSAR